MVYDPDSNLSVLLPAVICSFDNFPTVQLNYSVFMTYTRESQMKTLKVRYKFEPQLDCLVSFNNDTDGLKSGRHVAVRYYIEK